MNPVLRGMISLGYREWTLLISCQRSPFMFVRCLCQVSLLGIRSGSFGLFSHWSLHWSRQWLHLTRSLFDWPTRIMLRCATLRSCSHHFCFVSWFVVDVNMSKMLLRLFSYFFGCDLIRACEFKFLLKNDCFDLFATFIKEIPREFFFKVKVFSPHKCNLHMNRFLVIKREIPFISLLLLNTACCNTDSTRYNNPGDC